MTKLREPARIISDMRSPNGVAPFVSIAPRGAHPSYAHGFYDRDNDFYRSWDGISRERQSFRDWMRSHVIETADIGEYHARLHEQRSPA